MEYRVYPSDIYRLLPFSQGLRKMIVGKSNVSGFSRKPPNPPSPPLFQAGALGGAPAPREGGGPPALKHLYFFARLV